MFRKVLSCITSLVVVLNTFSGTVLVKAATNEETAVNSNISSEDNLKNGLKLYYTFEGSKNNVISDVSGNNNLGTLVGSASVSDDGKFGKGLNLDGNGYVKLPSNVLDDLNEITISTWIKYSSNSSDWERVFDLGKDTNNFFFLSKNRHIGINANSSPQDLGQVGQQVNDQWINIAVTLSNNTLIYYENGTEVSRKNDVTNKPSDLKNAVESYIGKSKFTDPYLHAKLDEFRIYNRALSKEEVASLSNVVVGKTIELSSNSENKITKIGDTLLISALVRPMNEKVNWSVKGVDGKDTDIAEIDSDGLLKSNKAGTVNVIATLNSDAKVYGTLKVTVIQKVNGLTVNSQDGKSSINTKGGTLQLVPSILPENATDKSVTWSLTDSNGKATNIATVDENGVVRARKNGNIIVTVTSKENNEVTVNCNINITNQDDVENKKLAEICPTAPAEQLMYDVENINNESAWGANNTHDPSIYKDGDWYYVFSTDYKVGGPTGVGLQVRKSKDLITWQWVGRVFSEIPAAAKAWAPKAENMWAPDVTKVNDTYYLYYTVSEFGSNNSFIGLATSKSLEGPWTDQGEVYKTKGGVSKDNALDPNIVTDANGDLHLVYGSYFGGIFVSKIDKNTGKLVTPGQGKQIGATGNRKNMEAPYVIYNPQFKKYYLFMSYDDLATDYNVRVGWSDSIDGPYTDFNGRSLLDTTSPNLYDIGTKFIGSYAFGNDPGWIAPGHNSVLNDNGDFYLVHHARGGADKNWAYLQVRKIVWTEDGKPMVSPERYAGEKEQKIDKSLIAGKWQTIVQNRLNNNKITSSDITLFADGKINDETSKNYWELSGDNVLKLHYYDPVNAPGEYWVDTVKVLPAWDFENWRPTLVYTGYNQDNTEIWGKQFEAIKTKVTNIKISTKDNKTNISEKGGKLELSTTVTPDYASDNSVAWSVTDSEGKATELAVISDNGVLTAVKDGVVRVMATAKDGSAVTAFLDINISGQTSEAKDNGNNTSPEVNNNPVDNTSTEVNTKPGDNSTKPTDNGSKTGNDIVVVDKGTEGNTNTTGNSISTNGNTSVTSEKVVVGSVSNNVLPVEVKSVNNKNGENVINLDSKAAENTTELTISDIASIRDGSGSLTINIGSYESIKLPFNTIDKTLLKAGSKIVLRTKVESNSDITKNIKGLKKVFGYELQVVDNSSNTSIHNFASGSAEITINLSDDELKGLDKNNLGVFYYNENAKTYEVMESSVSGNKVTFKTPHFSKFIIAEKNTNASNANITTVLPKTGSLAGSSFLVLSGLALIALGIVAVTTRRKKMI
ncbi:family 43 glycosylhydrolase [Clostridium sp. C8-1-8]|uniref:family 43 glycosylhydrolase n=1 Tax=Clostridium sp. C8-1-8 TaxID=2698831 RepID=UPI0013713FFB|nr:family 43 glycosylhydrolase [Clostridium sp. C8-1-8]